MAAAASLLARARRGLSTEIGPLWRLAWPVVVAEVGWNTMALVDTMMVGRVSAEALGGVAIGTAVFFSAAIFGLGILLGLDYAVASAVGAGRLRDAHIALIHGFYLAAAAAVMLMAGIWIAIPWLPLLGIRAEVLREAVPYLKATTWSMAPLLGYAALRRYLQALGLVRGITAAVLSANLINAAAGWIFIFGHFGAPAMGAEGAGWATCFARVYMLFFLLAYAIRHDRRQAERLLDAPKRLQWRRLREILGLGVPAASQTTLEAGVFGLATALAGRLDPVSLAAHQIALSLAAFTFMMPLGVSSAGAVRVGHAVGRSDGGGVRRAGWTSIALGTVLMAAAGIVFIAAPRPILRVFTTDTAVIAVGVSLLGIAAVFQLFDGIQVVTTGVMRGAGDTRTAMLSNLVGHWLLGLPVGYALCFWRGWGIYGLWTGLCIGLIAVAIVLLGAWALRARDWS